MPSARCNYLPAQNVEVSFGSPYETIGILKIKWLVQEDFDTYQCIASNALGKLRAGVELQRATSTLILS
jgi:hypothetical protein